MVCCIDGCSNIGKERKYIFYCEVLCDEDYIELMESFLDSIDDMELLLDSFNDDGSVGSDKSVFEKNSIGIKPLTTEQLKRKKKLKYSSMRR